MRYKDENKKDSIANAAIQIINKIGLAEASVSKIAKKAGVSSATMYIYFENKNDMITKLYLKIKHEMYHNIFNNIDSSLPIKEGFKLMARNQINYFLNNKEHFLFYLQFINSPLFYTVKKEQLQNVIMPFIKFVEDGKKQKILKDVDMQLIFVYATSPIYQIVKQCFNEGYILTNEIIDNAITMSWDAIKA